MRTELIDPIADGRWRALVERAPGALIFHHPAWLALVRDQYGYELRAVCVAGDEGLVAGLPVGRVSSRLTGRRLVSLPFSDLCPPLVDGEEADEARRALGGAVEEHRRGLGLPLEVRWPFPELPGSASAELYWLHTVDLVGAPPLHASTRRNVNKARRAGVEVERRTDRDALDTFYELHQRTRRHQGVPVQRRSFIRAFEGLFAEGLGFVALARIGATPVAGAVFAGAGRTLTYKFGASDRSALDARPNNLIFAEAIEWARADGYEQLDLGRTDLDNDGLRRFKSSWGATEQPLAYTYAGREPRIPGEGRGRRAMASIITNGPPIVGRAIGAALYRHVG